MASVVTICNLALATLGDSATVASIDPPEGSAQAQRCADFYPIARRQIFEVHNWSFLTRREKLAELDQESYGWRYVYAVPPRLIHVISITPTYDKLGEQSQGYLIEKDTNGHDVIYTDCDDAVIRYTRDTDETEDFTPTFLNALVYLLASKLAGPIISGTAGIKIGTAMGEAYEKTLPIAISRDSKQRKTDFKHLPGWIDWRRGIPDGTH